MNPTNSLDWISPDGYCFINLMCRAHNSTSVIDDKDSPQDVLDDWYGEGEYTVFKGGSGGRLVCEFPNSLLTDRAETDSEYPTRYVLKFCRRPNPQNFIEVDLWKRVYGESESYLFAPIIAWDESYRWLLMRRVTPVSPVEMDLAYIGTQDYVYSPNIGQEMMELLDDDGYDVIDPDENVGLLEPEGGLCMLDYGGVRLQDGELDIPIWVRPNSYIHENTSEDGNGGKSSS